MSARTWPGWGWARWLGAPRLGAESVETGTAGPWGRALETCGTECLGIISMVTPLHPHLPGSYRLLPQCGGDGNQPHPCNI